MASADEFFSRLRKRIAARTGPTPDPPAALQPLPATEATRERFFEELTRIGAVPHATDKAHAGETTLAIARGSSSTSFVCWRDGLVNELGLAAQLIEGGLARLDAIEPRAGRTELARANLVVSGCDLAFAENGALLMCTNAHRGRLLTALPRIHVALVGRSQLVYGLEALPAALRERGLPSGAVLHTGPTFSGDIEAIVVVGAHGPAELHVVWVDDA